uniref:TUB like protein 2 n=1 Tax=Nomascus leucogenys TaxID=61853 RepID=A0A2I3H8F6_NOMLE
MSQDNDTLRRDILGHELAAMRLQKLEQQRRLLEKKQRQKRQDLLMVHVNPEACLWRWRSCLRKERLLGDKGDQRQGLLSWRLRLGAFSSVVEPGKAGTPTPTPGLRRRGLGVWGGAWSHCESLVRDCLRADPATIQRQGCFFHPLGTRAEGESDSQDVGDAYKSPNVGPNPGMDGDWVYENLAFQKEEDLEKKREASESTGTNSSAATNEELSNALKGEGGTDSDHMRHEASLAIRSPCSGLEEDMEAYVLRPALPGTRMQCYLTRDNRSVDNGLFPVYYLYLETSDSLKHFLLAGRKSRRSKTSNYLISLDPTHLSRDGNNFVGKVRSNVFRTTFTIFDNGVNPDREHLIRNTARIRRELGAVCYEPNILGYLGPRKMTVILPGTNSQNQRINVRLLNESLGQWRRRGGLFMNFLGKGWAKALFLIHFSEEHLVLQFGRVGPDTFTMDFCFPFSPLQAFGICLSSFN